MIYSRRFKFLASPVHKIYDVVRFQKMRHEYYKKVGSNRELSESGVLFDTLVRDGIVVVPNFLSSEEVFSMLKSLPALSNFNESPEGDRALFYPEAHHIPAFRKFFDSSLIENLARAYISPQAIPQRRTVGMKIVLGSIETFEMFYHMDTWKQRLKAWCYLENVGPDQAPMEYLRGSHKRRAWRSRMERDLALHYQTTPNGFATEESFYRGCFWPHEVDLLKKKYGFDSVKCTGMAGTLVIFDGRGLHRATRLQSGRRTLLLSYWAHPEISSAGPAL